MQRAKTVYHTHPTSTRAMTVTDKKGAIMTKFRKILSSAALSVALLGGTAMIVTVISADAAYAGKGGEKGSGGKGNDASSNNGNGKSQAKSNGNSGRSSGGGNSKGIASASDAKDMIRGLLRRDGAQKKPVRAKSANSRKATAPAASPAPKPKGSPLALALGVHPSELGALNAAHASPNALKNASPNSRVGRIAAYSDEVEITRLLQEDLAAAQETLDGLEEPTRSVEDIDLAIAETEDQKSLLEDELAALQMDLADAGGSDDAIEADIEAVETAITSADNQLMDLADERADTVAYNEASDEVDRLEGELAEQEVIQRTTLEAAANKDVTDDVEIAVQKLLGIYQEPSTTDDTAPVIEVEATE